jgi:Collagen triple helix repeat (20 copies)
LSAYTRSRESRVRPSVLKRISFWRRERRTKSFAGFIVGEAGDVGKSGDIGDKGDVGVIGVTGLIGVNGDIGKVGDVGDIGDTSQLSPAEYFLEALMMLRLT